MISDTPTIRLVGSLHPHSEPDGGARVIDATAFTAAHVNRAARILLEALREPRTEQDLVTVLATAADCSPAQAAAPVARLLADLTAYGWIESP
ncbi:PqqD family protein [Streptomyces sp. NPDC047061]|uniref:PqqD family protein n=1 Tax=Streptomyces sp. NPDC047061 TaxID=3154605 RepID=UPI0033DBECC7